MPDSAVARHNMVESQIRTNKVTDGRLINALFEIPRERFVPRSMRDLAYVDEDLSVGGGRYLMEPMVLARLLQSAAVQPGDIGLVVGCGAGYAAAVLAQLCDTVVGVESDGEMATRAAEVLAELGIDNAAVVEGPLDGGYDKQAPYDVVFFDGAINEVPPAIAGQVCEGGRVVAVLEDVEGIGRATLMNKVDGVLTGRPVFDAAIPGLPGFERKSKFVF